MRDLIKILKDKNLLYMGFISLLILHISDFYNIMSPKNKIRSCLQFMPTIFHQIQDN